ncbi:DUF3857 domain-containing protein [Carboxylicivirga linearis]|uniref:DUF3857 domain-containing protein n=1 Tax=Carboxylicivirga linearis TaxID=1628157 RepID=A0ABS5JY71_9BACT|nr:DUF3857 domain-containing protein [Carboxylicivirga linearis]MBS2099825.1 DUF3857 domain-containing protein [Carboxylicivirga linearis]
MRYLILLAFNFSVLFVSAVNKEKSEPFWETSPEYSEISSEYTGENVVGLLLDERRDYYHDEEGDMIGTHTMHRKYRLNNEESINNFNKISVSLSDVIEVLEIRARVVKPDGKIVEFDENNIKEIKEEGSGNAYKIFAIDGIEVGDDVEYYVINKVSYENFGRLFVQYDYPFQEVNFEMITPKTILYDFKGYNGIGAVEHTTLDDERNCYTFKRSNVDAIKGEKFAYKTPRRQRIEYRLDYNLGRKLSQSLTWDDAAQRIYEMLYLNNDEKVLKKWISEIGQLPADDVEKVIQIEDFLKRNIFIREFHSPEFDDINFVYENKVTSSRGMAGLMAKLFNYYGIDHQVVLTSERDNVKFDPDFQSWNYLEEYLIYIPEANKYIDPSNYALRLGCFNGMCSANYGLFVELVNIGDFQSAIGKTKYIKATGAEENYHNMYINVVVEVDNAISKVNTWTGFKGLSGGFIGLIYQMADEEQKKNMLKSLMTIEAPETDITLLERNEPQEGQDMMADAEMVIHSEVETNTFVEEAGNKLLLHIGNTIGPQVEMYFEDERNPVAENQFNRSYYREIEFRVPDGYKIKNPEASVISVVEKEGEEPIFIFDSKYTYEGQQYKVIIDEYYKEIYVPEEHFEGFKNVVNAAADFNKVVLVLEPI